MTENDQQKPKLQLKNGTMADVEGTLFTLGYLRYLLDVEPKLFDALLALVQDRPQDADPKQVQALPKGAFFGPDGRVKSDVADVLLSSYVEVPGEGPVLVNPFKLQNETDKLLVERTAKEMAQADRQFGKWLLRFFGGRPRD